MTEAFASTKTYVPNFILKSIVRVTVRTRGFVQRDTKFPVKMDHHVNGNYVDSFMSQTNKKINKLK